MKINTRKRTLLCLTALTLFKSLAAASVKDYSASGVIADERSMLAEAQDAPVMALSSKAVNSEASPRDGKDGVPHDGPWVETSAEKERKKTGEDPDDPKTLRKFKQNLNEDYIPKTNDGVMDDPTRNRPKDGTRGTEGGISEKSKKKDSAVDETEEKGFLKKPLKPKEKPELPHSEKEKVRAHAVNDDTAATPGDDKDKKPLAKPADLPDKPHSIPHPENPSSPKDHSLEKEHQSFKRPSVTDEESGVIQPLHSLFLSFVMIICSEIGDKTFLVACLMAMRHDRLLVFSAAFSALVAMTVLSAILGHAVPALIPKNVTNFLAAGLFLVFGVRLYLEARKISPDEGVSEEMREVEMELEEKEQHAARRMSRHRSRSEVGPHILEAGRSGRLSPIHSPTSSVSSSREASPTRKSTVQSITQGLTNLFSLLLSPAWVQTFVMTFLGEWGDRSQIATIAMAAGQDYWWVTGGALGGHAICTGMAVIGGKAIAGKVSLRTVTMGGAIAFLVFGVIYLLEALY